MGIVDRLYEIVIIYAVNIPLAFEVKGMAAWIEEEEV